MKRLLLLLLLVAPLAAREGGLSWASDGQNIMLSWSHHDGKRVRLYRSTQPFLQEDLKDPTFPIANLGTVEGTAYLDNRVAPGSTYYYAGETDDGWWYQANPASLPPRRLPDQTPDAWILIDKLQYCLEVHSHGQMLKRYPVSFGVGAHKRKLRQDRASTPEGRYQISGRQPKAQWYKAFDINYPNSVDKARLKLLAPGQDIGGEIQIHGGGVDDNWTWGCIGMRNADIDELFRHPEIGRDTVVWIVGKELTYEDLESDEQAEWIDPLELGRWQRDQQLPVTCVQDRASRSRMKR
jgi:hypothetical protein